MADPTFCETRPDGVHLKLKVQPRASRDAVGEAAGGELKVRVTAPPVDSAANEAVIGLLARVLAVRPGAVSLVRGQTSRHKVVRVVGLSAAEIAERLTRSAS